MENHLNLGVLNVKCFRVSSLVWYAYQDRYFGLWRLPDLRKVPFPVSSWHDDVCNICWYFQSCHYWLTSGLFSRLISLFPHSYLESIVVLSTDTLLLRNYGIESVFGFFPQPIWRQCFSANPDDIEKHLFMAPAILILRFYFTIRKAFRCRATVWKLLAWCITTLGLSLWVILFMPFHTWRVPVPRI